VSRLHIVDTGNPDGPPIVWLGSLGSSTAMWDRQIAEFADCRCLLIDHPGHGSSPPSTTALTIESLGEDVLETLDDADIDHAHVVGLSLGAMIAMSLATNHPDRIDRLALLCTSAYFGPPDGWIDRAALVRAEGMPAIAEATVGRWITPGYAAAHPDEITTLVAMLLALTKMATRHAAKRSPRWTSGRRCPRSRRRRSWSPAQRILRLHRPTPRRSPV